MCSIRKEEKKKKKKKEEEHYSPLLPNILIELIEYSNLGKTVVGGGGDRNCIMWDVT